MIVSCLRPDFGARYSLHPPSQTGPPTTPQASRHSTDRIVAPLTRLLTLGSGAARFQAAPPAWKRASGSYTDRTSTGRRRRAYEHEEIPWHYVMVSPPVLLGARIIEARASHARVPGPDRHACVAGDRDERAFPGFGTARTTGLQSLHGQRRVAGVKPPRPAREQR